jgi:class 3 adenylate cyclase
MLFAATYPERTTALALFHPAVGPAELTAEEDDMLQRMRHEWGTQEYMDEMLSTASPRIYESEEGRRWFANWLRVSLSPEFAYALNRAFTESDLRPVLPAVRSPTVVLYRPGSVEEHLHLDVAARIEGAQSVPVSGGTDYWGIFFSLDIVDEIERFVAGEAPPPVPSSVLATLLFTDLVGSTERAAELGDQRWRELLESHHAVVRRELVRFRGEEKDTAGDGFFATFDGPARAIRCAQAIESGLRQLGLEIRAGVHTGECEVHEGKLAGIAVSIGARVASHAGAGEIVASQTVKDLVAGSGIAFEDRGAHELKGVPGEWRLYAVRSA